MNIFEIRKSIGGYSVDKKKYGHWTFVAKFTTKKQAQNFINKQNSILQTLLF